MLGHLLKPALTLFIILRREDGYTVSGRTVIVVIQRATALLMKEYQKVGKIGILIQNYSVYYRLIPYPDSPASLYLSSLPLSSPPYPPLPPPGLLPPAYPPSLLPSP